MMYVTEDIQVNSHCMTVVVALLLSTIMDQLAPVEFSS